MRKFTLTTKFTKDTKGSEYGHGTPCPYNFVLFVSFVVNTVYSYSLAALRAGSPCAEAWSKWIK